MQMHGNLTAGFDFVVHVSESAVAKVFQNIYLAGTFPNHVTYPRTEGTPAFEIFFGPPGLQFISNPSLSNPVRLAFPFLVRLDNNDNEFPGTASVAAATEKLSSLDIDNRDVTIIIVNFKALGDELFEFKLNHWSILEGQQLPWPPEFETLVKPAILNSIKATNTVELTPPAAPGAGYFAAKTYMPGGEKAFLGIFINNESNDNPDPPGQMASYLDLDEMRIAIPAQTVNAGIKDGLKAMGVDLDSLPATVSIGDDEFTVQKLSIKLRDGHLKVKGEIGDVEFSAAMGLRATDSGLKTTVYDVDIDLPWYMDILDVISFGAITRMLEEELPKTLGGLSAGAVSGMDLFSKSIPGSALIYDVHTVGIVKIRRDGIIVPANVEVKFNPVPIEKPTYIIAHKWSKEFHREGVCRYGNKIKGPQRRYFIREAAAIHQGYNGCWTCAREFSRPDGHVSFRFRSTGHAPHAYVEMSIKIEGKMLEPFIIDGVEVNFPPFFTGGRLKGKADRFGVWQQQIKKKYKLLGGVWQFQARSADMWTAECKFKVKRSTYWNGSSGVESYVSFTRGKPKGNFGYGEFPPFP